MCVLIEGEEEDEEVIIPSSLSCQVVLSPTLLALCRELLCLEDISG